MTLKQVGSLEQCEDYIQLTLYFSHTVEWVRRLSSSGLNQLYYS